MARVQKNKNPAYMYVKPVTLQPQRAQALDEDNAKACLRRLPRPKEDFTLHNLSTVTTLVFLLLRVKTVHDTSKRR